MKSKQKLELTWIGKENRPRLEPRILLEDPEKSYHAKQRVSDKDIFDNRLIFGDNLLALKALEQEFAGKVKCVYIDPPYNTGEALDHYDDGLEHSIWLGLMRDRLQLLYRLLHHDGLLWVHLDDSEVHYCKVLIDEVFGRENFVANITYERSGAAGLGLGGFVVNTGETILLYKKGTLPTWRSHSSQLLEPKTMKRYNNVLKHKGERKLVREFAAKSNGLPVRVYEHSGFLIEKISLSKFEEREDEIRAEFADNFDHLFRTNQIQKENEFQRDLVSGMSKTSLYSVDYIPSRGKKEGESTTLYYYNAELFAWLNETASLEEGDIAKRTHITNVWTHQEIPKADIQNEGGIDFPRSKKPEKLLSRIIEMSTQPGDIVLDSFAGSGTTGAVAHKMMRRWIMVELGKHCEELIWPRMKSVVDGSDLRGVTKESVWKGGGGFRYYHIAPTLLEKDAFDNLIISKQYNPAMLAEAMCKIMGFQYAPGDLYWQQGCSTETDYIYVTTQTLTRDHLAALSDEVGKKRSLLVCCAAFRGKADAFPNLTLKKIPLAVLQKCEWGHDDYSLNVANLPQAPEPVPAQFAGGVPLEPKQARKRRARTETMPSLFDGGAE